MERAVALCVWPGMPGASIVGQECDGTMNYHNRRAALSVNPP